MANTTELNKDLETVDTGLDSVVIVKVLSTKPGGTSLDVTNFSPTVIKAGHVVIKETSTGICKPHPISGTSYDTIPALHTYEGVVIGSVLTSRAMVGVLRQGVVNEVASPYPVTSTIKTAFSGNILFSQD